MKRSRFNYAPKLHTYFDNWSHNMAYVVGYIAADGNLFVDEKRSIYRITFAASEKDYNQLVRMKDEFSSKHKISTNHKGKYKNYVLGVSSPEAINALNKIGIPSKDKSLSIQWPEIPHDYIWDFIRGYFDGDGWIGIKKPNKNPNYSCLGINILGTYSLLNGIKKEFSILYGKEIGSLRKRKSNIHCLQYQGKSATKFAEMMYSNIDCNIRLYRKWKIYHDYIYARSNI